MDVQMSHEKTEQGLILDHVTLRSRADLEEVSIPLELIWIQV